MQRIAISRIDALRGAIAGSASASLRGAAQALFEAGGRRLLPASMQGLVRTAVEREASRLLTGTALLEKGATAAGHLLERGGTRQVVLHGTKAAGRQIFKSVSAAAGAGALVDGGWALLETMGPVRRGAMSRREAATHVAREAGTGAASTAVGVAAAAALVAVTGGVAAPALFIVGAAASLGAKFGLDALLRARGYGAIVVKGAATA